MGPYNKPRGRNKVAIGLLKHLRDGSDSPSASAAITEYLRESTIHGLKFLLEPRWWQKLFWIAAIVTCGVMAVYFSVQVIKDFTVS